MTNFNDEPLTEYDIQELDAATGRMQKYYEHKMKQAGVEKQRAIEAEVLKEISEEFEMEPAEVQRTLGTVYDPSEVEEAARLYKEGVRDYIRQRLAGKTKKTPGNRLQDEKGRFSSPRKIASEKAYAQKIAEMRERVQRGGRLSEDELLEIMPKLMR